MHEVTCNVSSKNVSLAAQRMRKASSKGIVINAGEYRGNSSGYSLKARVPGSELKKLLEDLKKICDEAYAIAIHMNG